MNQDLDGSKIIDLLYALGAIKHYRQYYKNNYKKNKLSEKMEKVFIEMYDWNTERRDNMIPSISEKLCLSRGTVKTYACYWYKIVGEIIGNQVDITVFKSSIQSFLFKPIKNGKQALGVLVDTKSITVTLNEENQEYLNNHHIYKNMSLETAVNMIIDKEKNSL
ncbi:MAG: hypothetical protein V7L21_11120 [Nostoc sp.]|uniref:hypothetical protein n=1 Tax=Nostoc sp. TaxID=1180 RepID=UPI002FF9A91B